MNVLDHPVAPIWYQAASRGVRFWLEDPLIRYEPDDALTAEEVAQLRQHRDVVRALVLMVDEGTLERATAFRLDLNLAPGRSIPSFIFRAGVPYAKGICFSCGDGLGRHEFGRCLPCRLAWRIAAGVPVSADIATVIDACRLVA